MHFGNSPLDYIAKAFVVDIKVLSAHRTLCPFFEFILTVTMASESVSFDPRPIVGPNGK
jgi:hypothetical protein